MGNTKGLTENNLKHMLIVAIICVSLMIALATIIFITDYFVDDAEEELEIRFTNNTPAWLYHFSPDYTEVEINGEICELVSCECHSNNPSCLSICYYCEEER